MTFRVLKLTTVVFIFFAGLAVTESLSAEEYSLEELYRIALDRSERIKISEEDLYISDRGKDKALSALLPTLSAFGGYTRYSTEKRLAGSIIQPNDAMSWGVRLDQSFSLGGREVIAFGISKENIEKSKYDLYAVKEGYLINVASAYYIVLRNKKVVEIAMANVTRLSKQRDAAATRLKVGEVTKTDLLRAEAELSGAQSELVRAENGLKLSKAVLARLVGLYGEYDVKESPPTLAGNQEYPDLTLAIPECGELLECLKEKAFLERAELRAAGLQKRISEEQVKFTQGAYWPILSIEGAYEREEDNPAPETLNREKIYGGVRLIFPFFEGGLRRAEVREAEARMRQAGFTFEDLKKTISIEVETAYLDFMTQKGVLKSLEDQLKFARDNYNSISKQYEFGLATSIDVIDSNTLLVTAERQLADAVYNYQLSVLLVERVAGVFLKKVVSQQSEVNKQNITYRLP